MRCDGLRNAVSRQKRLPTGSYTVSVVLDPDGNDEETAKAGTYTVK